MPIKQFFISTLFLIYCVSSLADSIIQNKSSSILPKAEQCLCKTGKKGIFYFQPDTSKEALVICHSDSEMTGGINLTVCGRNNHILEFDNVHEPCCKFKKEVESLLICNAIYEVPKKEKIPNPQICYTVVYEEGKLVPTIKAELHNVENIPKNYLSASLLKEIPNASFFKLELFIQALKGDQDSINTFLSIRKNYQIDGALAQEFSGYESMYNRYMKFK